MPGTPGVGMEGDSGGLERGSGLLAVGRKSFLIIEQIYSKLWLK